MPPDVAHGYALKGGTFPAVDSPRDVSAYWSDRSIAADVSDRFPEGIYFVPLGTINQSDLVLPTIAQALGQTVVLQRKFDPATRGNHFLATYARLKPGVDLKAAQAEMKQIARNRTTLTIAHRLSLPAGASGRASGAHRARQRPRLPRPRRRGPRAALAAARAAGGARRRVGVLPAGVGEVAVDPDRRADLGHGNRRGEFGGARSLRGLAACRFDDELMARRCRLNRSIRLAKKETGANGVEMARAQHQRDLPVLWKTLLE